MATVTLTFDNTEEQDEISDAINGWRWKSCLEELDDRLRSRCKYDAPFLPQSIKDLSCDQADALREMIREIAISNNLIFKP